MWVIKLGGSVTRHSSLTQWLQLVARWGDGKVIVVPGGGLYADAVRHFQQMRTAFADGQLDEEHAHALAIYAMDQMARSFVAMVPELVLVRNPLEIAERGWQHRGLVWLPSEMALNPDEWAQSGLPESWEVTSDSLAAWLALKLEAEQLILIKSDARILEHQAGYRLSQLQSQGIVDHGISRVLNGVPYSSWVMHQTRFDLFEHGFISDRLSGRIEDNH
ncbi:amino acid kinase family protein [Methylophilus aquaticus]|uniref:Aspartate/glutamate/uridylate kinase domain-containing protein n=1 Tax=Methylophilus aquaticus TaxID=1971610 RepID=A0ABT9JSM5_9PROT|nr:hypothetical protein [Methylophilus aquaticus]MDP8567115.1 hypothetical protein [Methylophilus aquaticus]